MDGQITIWQCFADMDREIKSKLQHIANNFIELGYLFKQARDSELYKEAGYNSLYEYIDKEYHITRFQAQRFMQLNDNYSLDGNSKEIRPEFIGYGSSKLTEMLGLPEEIRAEIPPETTVKAIREAKEVVGEENDVCDVAQTQVNTSTFSDSDIIKNIILEHFKEEKTEFKNYHETYRAAVLKGEELNPFTQEKLLSVIAPSKFDLWRHFGYSIIVKENDLKCMPFTPNNKQVKLTWPEFTNAFKEIFNINLDYAPAWEEIYNEEFEQIKTTSNDDKNKKEKEENIENETPEDNQEESFREDKEEEFKEMEEETEQTQKGETDNLSYPQENSVNEIAEETKNPSEDSPKETPEINLETEAAEQTEEVKEEIAEENIEEPAEESTEEESTEEESTEEKPTKEEPAAVVMSYDQRNNAKEAYMEALTEICSNLRKSADYEMWRLADEQVIEINKIIEKMKALPKEEE